MQKRSTLCFGGNSNGNINVIIPFWILIKMPPCFKMYIFASTLGKTQRHCICATRHYCRCCGGCLDSRVWAMTSLFHRSLELLSHLMSSLSMHTSERWNLSQLTRNPSGLRSVSSAFDTFPIHSDSLIQIANFVRKAIWPLILLDNIDVPSTKKIPTWTCYYSITYQSLPQEIL